MPEMSAEEFSRQFIQMQLDAACGPATTEEELRNKAAAQHAVYLMGFQALVRQAQSKDRKGKR